MFLDRIQARTGVAFDIINEAEESRLVFLAVRDALARHRGVPRSPHAAGGSRRRQHQPDAAAREASRTAPVCTRLGRCGSDNSSTCAATARTFRPPCSGGTSRTSSTRSVSRSRSAGITHMIAMGGDVRFAGIADRGGQSGRRPREIPRERFLAFCDEVERLDEDGIVERFRLPAVEAETLAPALLVYRALLSETAARQVVVSAASLRAGVLLDFTDPGGRSSAEDFERQVLASAEALGQRYRFDREHGQHVANLATRLFDELGDEHGLGDRERLLLQVAALLHDVGMYVSLRAHHKHSQYILAASQIFGLSDEETAIVSNIARYHRRGTAAAAATCLTSRSTGKTGSLVNKLAAILRSRQRA